MTTHMCECWTLVTCQFQRSENTTVASMPILGLHRPARIEGSNGSPVKRRACGSSYHPVAHPVAHTRETRRLLCRVAQCPEGQTPGPSPLAQSVLTLAACALLSMPVGEAMAKEVSVCVSAAYGWSPLASTNMDIQYRAVHKACMRGENRGILWYLHSYRLGIPTGASYADCYPPFLL